MRWRAKLSTSRPEPSPSKPSSSSAAASGGSARLAAAHGNGADHRAEHQPRRRRVLLGAFGQPIRPPPTSPPSTRIASGQSKAIGRLRRRMHDERIGERGRAGIDDAARLPERLVGLQHDGELGEIEAPDLDQRAGALLGGDLGRMREGVAGLAQDYEAERRRQIEGRRSRH